MYHSTDFKSLVENLHTLYADICLLRPETLEQIQEGAPAAQELCYSCAHRAQFCQHCAAKKALETHGEYSKLEYFSPDILHITARYLEVDGQPRVLETVQRIPSGNLVEADNEEQLIGQLTGYDSKLYHDALTGVYNRRYYEEVARSMTGTAGVAVMDLDDFKIYNDTYGHHCGDVALETAVDTVRRSIRSNDALIRFGGDEFLLVLPHITAEFFEAKLNQIRREVHAASVPGYPHLRLSVSVGGVIKREDELLEAAVRRADLLMYRSKEQKNQVIMADFTVPHPLQPAGQESAEKPQILIVDDSAINRAILSEILNSDFRILEAQNGVQCMELLKHNSGQIALVLLDLIMPKMDGFEVLSSMNRVHILEDVPVIMISSEESADSIRRAYELGASDYVARPFDSKVVYQRVFNTIKLYAKQRRLISLVSDQIRRREKNVSLMVAILSQIVEFRNGESALHVQHIRILTECILEWLANHPEHYTLSATEQDMIPLASALHDIGKVCIANDLLSKPGRLTPEEFNTIKAHTILGSKMLKEMEPYYPDEPLLKTAYEITRWHHERWDGRGYPDGLKGDEIPLSAQIVSIAVVYDALTRERCYQKAFPHQTAIQMIQNGECGAFNPVLLECLDQIESSLPSRLAEADASASTRKV